MDQFFKPVLSGRHALTSGQTSSNDPPQEQEHPKRRARLPVNCGRCYILQKKCDKQRPCSECEQHEPQGHCIYPSARLGHPGNWYVGYKPQFRREHPAYDLLQQIAQGLTPQSIPEIQPRAGWLPAALTSKEAVEKYITKFFSSDDPAFPIEYILHRATFMQEFEEHWQRPTNSSHMWRGLLHSVCCLGAQSTEREEVPRTGMSETFYGQAAKCIEHIDYTSPTVPAIEFLSLFHHATLMREQKNGSKAWIHAGEVVRLAVKMGYNKDPEVYSYHTPFQAEMGTRIWHFVAYTDLLYSFQQGMPAVARSWDYDTRLPQNFKEQDMCKTMTALPQPQLPNVPTPISYMVATYDISRVFRLIIEQSSAVAPRDSSTILALDDQLEKAWTSVPAHLQRLNLDSGPDLDAIKCYQLEHLYHQSLCILHRGYLVQGLANGDFDKSVTRCLESALSLLRVQTDLQNLESTGKKKSFWYTIPLTHDGFLLAAAILCVFLAAPHGPALSEEAKALVKTALASAHTIWFRARKFSVSTDNACRVIDRLLPNDTLRQSYRNLGDDNMDTDMDADKESDAVYTVFNDVEGPPNFIENVNWKHWDFYVRTIKP